MNKKDRPSHWKTFSAHRNKWYIHRPNSWLNLQKWERRMNDYIHSIIHELLLLYRSLLTTTCSARCMRVCVCVCLCVIIAHIQYFVHVYAVVWACMFGACEHTRTRTYTFIRSFAWHDALAVCGCVLSVSIAYEWLMEFKFLCNYPINSFFFSISFTLTKNSICALFVSECYFLFLSFFFVPLHIRYLFSCSQHKAFYPLNHFHFAFWVFSSSLTVSRCCSCSSSRLRRYCFFPVLRCCCSLFSFLLFVAFSWQWLIWH